MDGLLKEGTGNNCGNFHPLYLLFIEWRRSSPKSIELPKSNAGYSKSRALDERLRSSWIGSAILHGHI